MSSEAKTGTGSGAYAAAGVSVAEGDRAVALMRESVANAQRPEVVGGIGGFAGLFDASALRQYRRPLLATSTDGVGTKVAIAQAMDRHDTIGYDLVAMCVDDLVVCGAEPLFLTDYIACGHLVPERVADIVSGIAAACAEAGCALLGGETAEHPGVMAPEEYDVAGAATGVVEADAMLGPERVRAGDVLVAVGSSGLHSNGYSLVRRVLLEDAGWLLDREPPELGRPLGEELLEPTTIYARACLDVAGSPGTHALAHVTGGGLAANLARVLPQPVGAVVRRGTWSPQPVFALVGEAGGVSGRVSRADLEQTLNMGVGMVVVVAPETADATVAALQAHSLRTWVCGEVVDEPGGEVHLTGDYAPG